MRGQSTALSPTDQVEGRPVHPQASLRNQSRETKTGPDSKTVVYSRLAHRQRGGQEADFSGKSLILGTHWMPRRGHSGSPTLEDSFTASNSSLGVWDRTFQKETTEKAPLWEHQAPLMGTGVLQSEGMNPSTKACCWLETLRGSVSSLPIQGFSEGWIGPASHFPWSEPGHSRHSHWPPGGPQACTAET